ncbi:hypothetical protein V6M85_12535 [Sulfolobus tengchongensis]|uniref:Uncharacterized protein n=1 Tax=Sulfolobus tengchongensis TaxID=207809 RepID=A0AAX4L120_9CREN
MKEESYQLLEYIAERGVEGTTTALETDKGVPILLVKENSHTLTAIICINGIAKRITKKYTRTTVHKAIYDLINEIGDILSQNIEELKISQKISFENCIEEKTEVDKKKENKRKIIKKEKSKLPSIEEYKKIELPQKHILPLLHLGDKKYLSLLMELGIIDVFELALSSPLVMRDNQTIPYKIKDMRPIYTILSMFKLDTHYLSNPFSTININGENISFFTALYNDLEVLSQFTTELLQKNLKLIKHKVRLFTVNMKGGFRPVEIEILNSKNTIDKNNVRVGLFIKNDKGDIIQIGDLNLGELHEKNLFTINEYIYSSLYIMKIDDYTFFDNIVMKLLNSYIAKSNYSKLTKDIIERETNINYSIPFMISNTGNKVIFAHPILFWYSREVLNTEEICEDCPAIEYANKFDQILNAYLKLGYFRNVFL